MLTVELQFCCLPTEASCDSGVMVSQSILFAGSSHLSRSFPALPRSMRSRSRFGQLARLGKLALQP